MAMRLLATKTIIRRPTTLAPDGTAYVATWVDIEKDGDGESAKRVTLPVLIAHYTGGAVILIKIGAAEAFARPDKERPMPDDMGGDLARTPPPSSADNVLMASGTVTALLDGARPDLARLYRDLAAIFRRFVAFPATDKVTQEDYAALLACYVISTYLIAAFPAVGYLWLTGLAGSGKSTVALIIARLACIPLMASSSGTLASLRGHADSGGTLILDNYEAVTGKDDTARNLRSFCELGYQDGAVVTLQVPSATGRGWETARCNVFCNRVFTAVAEPPDALASRCIKVTMLRTDDTTKANLSPQDNDNWTVTPRDLIQRCWMVAAHHLNDAAKIVRTITSDATGLTNRDLQVWRPVLTVARLIDNADAVHAENAWDVDQTGTVTASLLRLAKHLLNERADDDDRRDVIAARALLAIAEEGLPTTTPAVVISKMRQQYHEQYGEPSVNEQGKDALAAFGLDNARKVGTLFKRMGIPKTRKEQGVVYAFTPAVIARLRSLYPPTDTPYRSTAHTETTGTAATAPPAPVVPVEPAYPVDLYGDGEPIGEAMAAALFRDMEAAG